MIERFTGYKYKGRHRAAKETDKAKSFDPNYEGRHRRTPDVKKRRGIAKAAFAAIAAVSLVVQPWSSHSSEKGEPSIASASAAGIKPSLVMSKMTGIIDQTPSRLTDRLTGIDKETTDWGVGGTDLAIPVALKSGKTAYFMGDTFDQRDPGNGLWRSQVGLTSETIPGPDAPIKFDGALGLVGKGIAPELMPSPHDTSGNGEHSGIFTDVLELSTGEIVAAYQSVKNWDNTGEEEWATGYAGLAVSHDGGASFERTDTIWENDAENSDPFQMVSMQEDNGYVYMVSNKAGRKNADREPSPVMLRRVPTNEILNKDAYECWDSTKGWGDTCKSLFNEYESRGELSLRKLTYSTPDNPNNVVYVLSYLKPDKEEIVSRFAPGPTGPWSQEKVQVTGSQLENRYGGLTHPDSTPDNMTFMVSSWVRPTDTDPGRYDVSQFNGTLW